MKKAELNSIIFNYFCTADYIQISSVLPILYNIKYSTVHYQH